MSNVAAMGDVAQNVPPPDWQAVAKSYVTVTNGVLYDATMRSMRPKRPYSKPTVRLTAPRHYVDFIRTLSNLREYKPLKRGPKQDVYLESTDATTFFAGLGFERPPERVPRFHPNSRLQIYADESYPIRVAYSTQTNKMVVSAVWKRIDAFEGQVSVETLWDDLPRRAVKSESKTTLRQYSSQLNLKTESDVQLARERLEAKYPKAYARLFKAPRGRRRMQLEGVSENTDFTSENHEDIQPSPPPLNPTEPIGENPPHASDRTDSSDNDSFDMAEVFSNL